MSTIALVPGSGLGAWAWSRVTPQLRDAGHDVHPLTLTGTGDRAHLAHPKLDLSSWITDVVAHLDVEELEDVVLVGHSFCGAVITGVAERVPERLSRLVYLDAVVLDDGQSVFDQLGPELAGIFEAIAAGNDGWSLPWPADEQLDQYYGDHGLSGEDLTWIRRHVTTHPIGTYREQLAAGNATAAALPRTYVRCTATPTPPPVQQGADGWDWAELDTGHWPMITKPNETAALLDSIANKNPERQLT
jgi:pimeloyl-ACP methyl ester carboxylesterase